MLSKSQRLNLAQPENQDFFRVFRVVYLPHSRMYWRPTPLARAGQQAAVVGKKVSLKAVVRNQVKRWCYQWLEQPENSHFRAKYDVVILVTQLTEKFTYSDELTQALSRLPKTS